MEIMDGSLTLHRLGEKLRFAYWSITCKVVLKQVACFSQGVQAYFRGLER